jgi:hypothetical protein
MIHWHRNSSVRKVLILVGVAAFLIVCIYGYMHGPLEAVAKNLVGKNELPLRGKLRQPTAPKNAIFGMIYINTKDNREYIFDGADWVPHDNSVDEYYRQKDKLKSQIANDLLSPSLLASQVSPTGECGTGTGAHDKHAAFDCLVCHYVGGVLCFDINGPAVSPGNPLPSFDATAKTCSSIACHGVPAGTFSYYFPGGDGEPVLNTVTYGGAIVPTPSWYTTGLGCGACHSNPPRNGAWHSGYHGGQGPTGPRNQCQFCHSDATGSSGLGTTITNPALHANGTVEVQARFTSSCFGCH